MGKRVSQSNSDIATKKHRGERKYYDFDPSEPYNAINGMPYSQKYYDILKKRMELPAFKQRKKFLKMFKKNDAMILVGDTGSGKTTQCPQFIIQAQLNDGKCIAVTQPRRVAAMSVASRVAEEMDVTLGQEVGYKIRFEDCTSEKTILKYCTDGSLLREIQSDPLLSNYSVIILDEAHERTLDTDILFGILKNIRSQRKDLKILVMSATLNFDRFMAYFDAPLLTIEGRTFPVEIFNSAAPVRDYYDAAMKTIIDIHTSSPPGDILCFLTGEDEIENLKAELEGVFDNYDDEKTGPVIIVPLYSALPPAAQKKVFCPTPTTASGKVGRKIVIATNVAETSITIDGIVYVVDPGFSKQKVYNPRNRIESLLITPISQASAIQRAGRAGRTREGKCYRLYTEKSFKNELIKDTHPEILRSNLSRVLLSLLRLGITNFMEFDFIEAPAAETVMRALEELHILGAINDDGELTAIGSAMAEMPIAPPISAMILRSAGYSCTREIIMLAAMLSVQSPYVQGKSGEVKRIHRQFLDDNSDHISLINVLDAYINNGENARWCYDNYFNDRALSAASKIYNQLYAIYSKLGYEDKSDNHGNQRQKLVNIRKSIFSGFFFQIALSVKGKHYKTVPENLEVLHHPSSSVTHVPPFVVYNELILTTRKYIRTITAVNPEWLLEVNKEYYEILNRTVTNYDVRKALKF